MKKLILLLVVVLAFCSCSHKTLTVSAIPENQDQLILSVLWFQKSPEMRAMYYQGYNNATKSLAQKLNNSENKKPKAVVMDIDETILDNSPVEAYQIINNVAYNDTLWNKWTDMALAEPLPGALEFVHYAKSVGVEVFYVSNRSESKAFNSTITNLREKGFPYADSLHLILKTSVSSKEERRQAVAENYDILLFIGDNMGDFDIVFDNREDDLGFGAVNQNISKFGDSYIILPNPMYGPWINAAIKEQPGATIRTKILNAMKSF